MGVDFEEVYRHAGELGPSQLRYYVIMFLGIVFGAMQILQLSFTGAIPAHRCATVCDEDDVTYEPDWLPGAVPYEDGVPSQCTAYTTPACNNNTGAGGGDIVECDSWVYDDQYYTETSVSEFDLVCDRSYLVPLASSILMSGELFGSMLFGRLSDKIGRKKTWALAAASTGIASMCSAVIPSLPVHMIAVCLCSMGGISVLVLTHVVVMETVGKKYRILLAAANQIAFSLGETFLGVIAYGVRKWRNLLFLISLPFFILAPVALWIMPESPRWLLLQGRWKESSELLKKIAKGNKKRIPEKILPNEDSYNQNDDKEDKSLSQILRRPKLRIITLVIYYNWFVSAILFYGLSFNASNVDGVDPFILHYMIMLAEIPGPLCSLAFVNKIGRKKLTMIYFLVAGVTCLISGGVYEVNMWASVALSLVGKASVAGIFCIAFVYAGEMYPTYMRGSAVGAASMSARPGAIIAPYIAYLGDIKIIIPLSIFGGLGLSAGILTYLFLPETLGRPLPESLEDSENFNRKAEAKRRSTVKQDETTESPVQV